MKLFVLLKYASEPNWSAMGPFLLECADFTTEVLVDVPTSVALGRNSVYPDFLLPDEKIAKDGAIELSFTQEPSIAIQQDIIGKLCARFDCIADGAYVTSSNIIKDYSRTWHSGEYSPGVKVLLFGRRLVGTTREEFARHWHDIHAPLAREHHVGIWRYLQNVVSYEHSGGDETVDGIDQLNFQTEADMTERFIDSEEGGRITEADARTFVMPVSNYLFKELLFSRD